MSHTKPILLEEDEDQGSKDEAACAFHVGENTYDTVEFISRSDKRDIIIKNNANKKCITVLSVLLIIAILLGVAVTIAFPIVTKFMIQQVHSEGADIRLQMNSSINEVNSEVELLKEQLFGHSEPFPVPSCAALPPSSPSGYYWVKSSSNMSVNVYCDMTKSCGGVTGGWTRVAELYLAGNESVCPNGFTMRIDDYDVVTCVYEGYNKGCFSIAMDTKRITFSMVCGMVVAYQFGNTHAFNDRSRNNIETNYVDGISLTHGKPRRHIWTFAAALNEMSTDVSSTCPCINSSEAVRKHYPPFFVGNDYFCDTGSQYSNTRERILYTANPLWDGAGCGQHSTCCSFNNPPWFYKQLPQPTSDDIEMRVCRDEYNWILPLRSMTFMFVRDSLTNSAYLDNRS